MEKALHMVAMAYPQAWPSGQDYNSDAALVERALENDLAAFEQLVSRYQTKIVAYATRMLSNQDDGEDVAQEVFIKAYRSLESFRGASSFSTWLYRIATNLCIDRVRKRKRSPQEAYSLDEPLDKDEEHGGRDLPDTTAEPMRNVERDELRQQVRLTVAEMPEKLRSVLLMCDIQGMSYEDIAESLQCPIGTVKSRLFHARADLARRLRPYMHGVK
jgi:RNA polymerase sigma-70 factor (ECF subfamily)